MLKAARFAGDVLAQSVCEGLPEGCAEAFIREQNVNGERVTLALIKK